MAVRAAFIADFSQFMPAVEKAVEVTQGFERQLASTDKDLQRFGKSFSGDKILKDAQAAAQALEAMGGASKLTATEQSKMNRLFGEAIAKAEALGTSVPESIRRMHTETTKSSGAFDNLKKTLTTIGPAMAAAFSVTAIIGVGKKVLDFSGEVVDLSAKLGISTKAIQEWQLAFEPAGVSIETVTKAATELANKVVGGDKSAAKALEQLGINVETLKSKNIEDMFETVADAVGNLQNKAEQIYAGKTLFGKSGVELLAGLDGKLRETTDRFQEMGLIVSEESLKAADDFGDSLGVLGKQLLAVAAEAIGPLMPALTGLATLLGKVAGVVGTVIGFLVKMATVLIVGVYGGITKMLSGLADMATKIPIVGKYLTGLGDAADWLRQQSASAFDYVEDLTGSTEKAGVAAELAAPKFVGLGDDAVASMKKAAVEAEKIAAIVEEALVDIGKAAFDRESERGQLFDLESAFSGLKLGDAFLPNDLLQAELQRIESTLIPGLQVIGEAIPEALLPPPSRWSSFVTSSMGALPSLVGDVIGGMSGTISGRTNEVLGKWQGQIQTALPAIFGGGGGKGGGLFGQIMSSGLGALMGPAGPLSGLISAGIQQLSQLALKGLGKMWNGIRGLFGTDEEALKVNPARDSFLSQFGGAGTGEGSGFLELAKQLTAITGEAGGGALFRALTGADTMEEFDRAVSAITEVIGKFQSATATPEAEAGVAAIEGAGLGLADLTNVSEETVTKLHAAMTAMSADMLQFAADLRDPVITAINETIAALDAIPRSIDIAVRYAGAGAPSLPVVPMAAGGAGVVTEPTLFLAGEAGPEAFAFSGAGQGFGDPGASEALHAMRRRQEQFFNSFESAMRTFPRDIAAAAMIARGQGRSWAT